MPRRESRPYKSEGATTAAPFGANRPVSLGVIRRRRNAALMPDLGTVTVGILGHWQLRRIQFARFCLNAHAACHKLTLHADCLLASRALEHQWPLYRRSNRAGDSPPFPRAFATLAFAYHNHASPARHARPPTLLAMRRPALLKWLISVVLITGRGHLTPLPLRSADERYHRRRFVLTANNNAGMSLPGGVVSTDWTFTSAVLSHPTV